MVSNSQLKRPKKDTTAEVQGGRFNVSRPSLTEQEYTKHMIYTAFWPTIFQESAFTVLPCNVYIFYGFEQT